MVEFFAKLKLFSGWAEIKHHFKGMCFYTDAQRKEARCNEPHDSNTWLLPRIGLRYICGRVKEISFAEYLGPLNGSLFSQLKPKKKLK